MSIIVFALILLAGIPAFAQRAGSPCSLVTRTEVEEAAGSEVTEVLVDRVNKSVCHYKVGAAGSDISLLLTSRSPTDSAEKTVAELIKRKIAANLVPGFGDGAYSASPGYGMQQLGVYKGRRHVVVTVLLMGTPVAKSKDVAIAVMRRALARL